MKPGTFTQMYVMLVFAIKNREALLRKDIREKVFEYTGGIITNLKQKSLIVNGTSNHIHILYGLNPNVSVSDTVYHIKRGSSLFINNEKLCKCRFSWQEGYGAFSYSRSQINDVYNYIRNQEQHHASITFRQEYTDMLKEAEIIYDDIYLFEFPDELE